MNNHMDRLDWFLAGALIGALILLAVWGHSIVSAGLY